MVSIEKIREEMRKYLIFDTDLHQVEVNASSIDEALADAALQLDVKLANLEFEVVEKGSDGFLGFGKKPWKLKISQTPESIRKKKIADGENIFDESGESEEEKIVSRDGLFYVHRFDADIKLKIVLPIGEGRAVDIQDVLNQVKRSDTTSFDEKLIAKYVKQGTEDGYKTVGAYNHVASGDAALAVDISKDEMHATITVDPPAMSGADITVYQIENALKIQGVRAGINDEKILEFVDSPIYSSPVEVASAILPEDGKDSYLEYKFETDQAKLKAKESEGGKINFKETNRIQNVVAGQVLATKILATRGKAGKTVYGHYLEAKNGKDIPVQLGQNVQMEKDGVTVTAQINGQVLLVNGKITVEPVLNLDAVNIKSGNINFLGMVYIRGNVEDGFDVKASGNIDIGGTVGKCNIEADGDIIIHQGVFGKNEGSIKCGKSLWVKFVQEMKIDVGENLIATDSLMNCEVSAMKNIIVYGKKAQITGGNLFASEEICAKTLGSPGGGTTTTLTVGVDPIAKKRLDELIEKQGLLVKELEKIDLDIGTLENQKKMRRSLPSDKEAALQKLISRKDEIVIESNEMSSEINELQEHLRDLKAVGKVKVEGITYPGTKIFVRDVLDEIHSEVKNCTFYFEDSFAKRAKYEPPLFDYSKGPEGYN